MVDHSLRPKDRCPVCWGKKGQTPCGKTSGCLNSHLKRCTDCRAERKRIEAECQAALAQADIEAHGGVA